MNNASVDPALALKAKLFRGLSDPSRLVILECLRSGEKSVSEIVAATGQSQPNVSGHLACLKNCGLVQGRQEGRNAYYSLGDARMEALIEAAEGILFNVSERVSQCSNYECKSNRKCVSNRRCSSPVRGASSPRRRDAREVTPLPIVADTTEGQTQ